MEFLNKIELKGVVGRVVETQIGDKSKTSFSLMTEDICSDAQGNKIVEVTWFNCSTFDDISIEKGDKVHCLGRIRALRYVDNSGAERMSYEVVTNSVTILQKVREYR